MLRGSPTRRIDRFGAHVGDFVFFHSLSSLLIPYDFRFFVYFVSVLTVERFRGGRLSPSFQGGYPGNSSRQSLQKTIPVYSEVGGDTELLHFYIPQADSLESIHLR